MGPKLSDPTTFGDPTPYNIMFGPDKCGYTKRFWASNKWKDNRVVVPFFLFGERGHPVKLRSLEFKLLISWPMDLVGYRWLALHINWCESERYNHNESQCRASGSTQSCISEIETCGLGAVSAKRVQLCTNTGPTCLVGTSCSISVTITPTLIFLVNIRDYLRMYI